MASPTFSLIPTDVRNDPALFFAQLDLYFRQKTISGQTEKFCHVATILPQDVIVEVRDLIISPPTEKPYDTLRERVTTAVSVSAHRRISQLLEQETMGDSTPSQFLKRLQKLAEGTMDNNIVKHIFLQRIPTEYKVVIAAQDESMPVERVAEIADHIADIMSTRSSTVAGVQTSEKDELLSKLMEGQTRLEARMNKMAEDIARLTLENKQRRGGARSHCRERKQDRTICWKHKRFGEKANSCIPPCSYKSSGKA